MRQRISMVAMLFAISLLWSQVSTTSAVFGDVASNHPNKVAIDFVQSKGIVSGYPDGTYQPDRLLNRAEFTKIIVESRFEKVEIDNCVAAEGFYKTAVFSDVESGVWFEKYICVAKKNSVIAGYPDGSFKPIQTINFAEAAKILANSYGLNIGTGEPWFTPFVQKLESLEAVPPTIASLGSPIDRALKTMSRGEMAEVIYRLRNISDTISSADGSFSIKIPEKALPEGVSINSITIERLPVGQGPIEEVNGAPMVFYKLEPDGMKFRQPVTFSVMTPTLKNTIPMVFLVSGNSFDMIPDPIIEIDQGKQQASLSGRLEHFSTLALGYTNVFQISRNVIPDQPQQKKFETIFEIERMSGLAQFLFPENGRTLTIESGWSITNGVISSVNENLAPRLVLNAPSSTLLNGPNEFTIKKIFQCVSSSPTAAAIRYGMNLNFVTQGNPGARFSSSSAFISIFTNTFKCLPEVVEIVDAPESPENQNLVANPFNLDCDSSIALKPESQGGVRVDVLVLTRSNGICLPYYTAQGIDFFSNDEQCPMYYWSGPPAYALDGQTYTTSSVNSFVTQGCGFGGVAIDNLQDDREAYPAYLFMDPEALANLTARFAGTPPAPAGPPAPPFDADPSNMNCFGVTLGTSLASSVAVEVVQLPNTSCVRKKDLYKFTGHGATHWHATSGSAKTVCNTIYVDGSVPFIFPADMGFGIVGAAREGTIYVDAAYYATLGYPN